MKDYIALERRRDPLVTPRLIIFLVAFLSLFGTALIIFSP